MMIPNHSTGEVLGAGSLAKRNIAFLGKRLWRFPLESGSLRHRVVKNNMGCMKMGGIPRSFPEVVVAGLGLTSPKSATIFSLMLSQMLMMIILLEFRKTNGENNKLIA
ncbi:hypothetical protein ACOSP7_011469 [Xanthoceras sorbifolium]